MCPTPASALNRKLDPSTKWASAVQRKRSLRLQTPATGADTPSMPGVLHQGILWLFEDDPWLAFDVLGLPRPVDGTPIDRWAAPH